VTRLVIDARLAGHSGIGVYLEHMLPRIVERLIAWRPVVLARSATCAGLASHLGAGAEVVAWDTPPLGPSNLWRAPWALRPSDLLWTPHFNVPLRGSAPLAVTLHDVLPLSAPRLAGFGRSVPVRLWLRAIRARARVVFCVSEFTQREVMARGGLGASRVLVTPLGVDRQWFGTASGHRSGDGDAAQPTIVFVGLLKPHKNAARLLRAFDRVKSSLPHRLLLVARHDQLRNVDRAAMSMVRRLGDRVELVADLPLPDLVAQVASAQFLALPSLHEGFGLPALEAMAAGTPVLAARAGALPEVCGDAAAYCDPLSVDDIARGLVLLAGDPALRARLAAAGRVRAAAFTWERCAAGTAEALEVELCRLRVGKAS
jgi:glycosyltransferase involved in cell wall biosynthesis